MKAQVLDILKSILRELSPEKNLPKVVNVQDNILQIGAGNFQLEKLEKVNLIGIGKNATQDIRAFNKVIRTYKKDFILNSVCAFTKKGASIDIDCSGLVFEGDHPYLTQENLTKSIVFLEEIKKIEENDLTIVFLSGGASALLEDLPHEIPFDIYDKVQKELLGSELSIKEINFYRKTLSLIKNGGLSVHIPSKNIFILTSNDTPEEGYESIGSSPFHHQRIKVDQAIKNFEKLNLDTKTKEKIFTWLKSIHYENHQMECRISQTRKNIRHHIAISTENLKRVALVKFSSELANIPIAAEFPIYNCSMKEVVLKEIERIKNSNDSIYLSGGEGSLKLPSEVGEGGRNTHFCAVMGKLIFEENVLELDSEKLKEVVIFSLATDGSDGSKNDSGAILDWETFQKNAEQHNLSEAIKSFNSWQYFNNNGGLIQIKPMGVNLMDLRGILIPRN